MFAGRDGCAHQIDILHDAECLAPRELKERIENHARAETVPHERNRPYAQLAVDECVGEDQARGTCALRRIGPRIVNEVVQLGKPERPCERCVSRGTYR